MRIIERSEFRGEGDTISLENQIRGTLRHGTRWRGEMEAQIMVSEALGRGLGGDYVLVRNLTVPGTLEIVPMVLVGPQGVRAIVPAPLRGIFRAKGEEWLSFSSTARHFKRVRPNQQAIAEDHAQAVLRYLVGQGYGLPDVEAVLVFTNPRTHVDSARPRVRIVMADGIEHFAANLQQLKPIMDGEDVEAVVNALLFPRMREGDVPAPVVGGLESQPVVPPDLKLKSGPIAVPSTSGAAPPGSERDLFRGAQMPSPDEAEVIEDAVDYGDQMQRVRQGVAQIAQEGGRLAQEGWVQGSRIAVEQGERLTVTTERLARRVPHMTTGQWVFLAVVALFDAVILITLALMVMRDFLYS
jgi:hypothetical protein